MHGRAELVNDFRSDVHIPSWQRYLAKLVRSVYVNPVVFGWILWILDFLSLKLKPFYVDLN